MTLTPDPVWLTLVLAAAVLVDVLLSLRPPAFIRQCLDGVGFPREWWWTLIVIKSLAVAGLVIGLFVPGIGLAANAGVVADFGCAAAAHLRSQFFGSAFWINCLGLLTLASGTLLFCYLV